MEDRLFTSINIERRDVKNSHSITGEKNTTNFISIAVNTILTDRIGAFVRYKFAESKVKEGVFNGKKLPYIPRHAIGAGLLWVLPSYIKAMLSTNYISGLYGNEENSYKLPDFLTTDISLTWESLKKNLMIKLDIKNIFDTKYETKPGYPSAGMSVYLSAEYRF